MAEAWAKHFGNGRVEAFSAGSHPFGSIVKDTQTVMSEKGVSLDGQSSKGLRDVAVADMDVVVVMGSEVECMMPVGFEGCKEDWEIPDPYGRSMSATEMRATWSNGKCLSYSRSMLRATTTRSAGLRLSRCLVFHDKMTHCERGKTGWRSIGKPFNNAGISNRDGPREEL